MVVGHAPHLELDEARALIVLVQCPRTDKASAAGVDVGGDGVQEKATRVEGVADEEPTFGVVEEAGEAVGPRAGAAEAREDDEGAEAAEAGEEDVEGLR